MRHLRPAYTSARERRLDFWGGFAGNIVLSLLLIAVTSLNRWTFPLELPLEAVLLVILAVTRSYIAFGVVMSFVIALMAVVIAAPVGFVACLVLHPSDLNTGFAMYLAGLLVALVPAFFVLRSVDRHLRRQDGPAEPPGETPGG